MEDIKVYALDDDGNRIEPKSESKTEEKKENTTEQVAQEEKEVKEENKIKEQKQDELSQQKEESKDSEKTEDKENVLQKVSEEVLDNKENTDDQASKNKEDAPESEKKQEPVEDDNWFLSKLKDRYDKEFKSIDVFKVLLNSESKKNPDVSEEVQKFIDYKKETGRSFQDFAELQKDWSSVSDSEVIREYFKQTKPHLDQDDIDYLIKESYSFDEEADEEKDIRRKKVAYKEALYNARNHFETLKEKYKAPLESSSADIPNNYKEAFSFYNEYQAQVEEEKKLNEERSNFFTKKTNDLFNDEFKGFEFNLGNKKQSVKPSDLSRTREAQGNLNNFLSEHLDEKGFIKDPTSYHRALYAAMNPDQLAKYFYEQGKSDATGDIVRETKNIDMSVRDNKVNEVAGTKYRVVDSEDQFEFKIRKRN